MKNFCSNLFRCPGMAFLCFMMYASCVEDAYDLKGDFDETVQLGGDSLYLPLGSTQEFFIKSLLGEDLLDGFLKVDANGVYVLSPDAQATEVILSAIASDQFRIADVSADTIIGVPVVAKPGGQTKSTIATEWDILLDFQFDDLPESILSLDEMTFDDTWLDISLEFANLPSGMDISQMTPDIYVSLPDDFAFSEQADIDADHRLHITSFNTPNGFLHKIPLAKVILEEMIESHKLHFSSLIQFTGSVDLGEGSAKNLAADLDLRVNCVVRQIDPKVVQGIFDPEIDKQETEVAFDMIPDALRVPGTVLDFEDPHISLAIESNTDIPVNARVEILPVASGKELMDKMQVFNIKIPAMGIGSGNGIHYWLAGQPASMPQGYTFVAADVASLIREIPDMLRISILASSDTTATHRYDFGKTYTASASFAPEVPLVFGGDLFVSFSDTMADLPEAISETIAGKEMSLYGYIYNKFPLDFRMQLVALDEQFRPLPILLSEPQLVKAGDGSDEISSKVEFKISDPESVLKERKLAAFRIACVAASNAEAAGIPITENASFRAEFKLKLVGGLIIGGSDGTGGDEDGDENGEVGEPEWQK